MSELSTDQPSVSKTCPRCCINKPLGAFGKGKGRKGGLQVYCKLCKSVDSALYYETHKEQRAKTQKRWNETHKEQIVATCKQYSETHKEQKAATAKQWYENNKGQALVTCKQYRESHKEQRAETCKQWQKTHREEINLYIRNYQKERRLKDPNFKTACCIRGRLRSAIRGGYKAGSAVKDLGCSMEFLIFYLKSQFWPEMSWENQGYYGWHIDHVIPLESFDLTNREQFLKACHYTNIQPLWWDDNRTKSDRLDWTPAESKHELPERLAQFRKAT